jgi:hypothetical protein
VHCSESDSESDSDNFMNVKMSYIYFKCTCNLHNTSYGIFWNYIIILDFKVFQWRKEIWKYIHSTHSIKSQHSLLQRLHLKASSNCKYYRDEELRRQKWSYWDLWQVTPFMTTKQTTPFAANYRQTDNILDKIDEYRRTWLLHLQRMPQNRIPLKSFHYSPQVKRTIGRPKKRWREQL